MEINVNCPSKGNVNIISVSELNLWLVQSSDGIGYPGFTKGDWQESLYKLLPEL